MMGLADAEHGEAVLAGLGHQRGARQLQQRQRKAVVAVAAQHARSHVLERGNGPAVDPAAVERAEIAGDAEDAVAVGAVALGGRHVVGEGFGDDVAAAVAPEDDGEQRGEVGGGDARVGHGAIRGQVSESL
mgnify:CR=1 FL=1